MTKPTKPMTAVCSVAELEELINALYCAVVNEEGNWDGAADEPEWMAGARIVLRHWGRADESGTLVGYGDE